MPKQNLNDSSVKQEIPSDVRKALQSLVKLAPKLKQLEQKLRKKKLVDPLNQEKVDVPLDNSEWAKVLKQPKK